MNPNDSRPTLVRAVVACVVLGALMVSCGDDDDSASTAATTPATPFATAEPTGTATTAPAAPNPQRRGARPRRLVMSARIGRHCARRSMR